MAVLPIRITGDRVLHEPAAAVSDFGADLRRLVDDPVSLLELLNATMLETMPADCAPRFATLVRERAPWDIELFPKAGVLL